MSSSEKKTVAENPDPSQVRLHLCFGWWALLAFLTLGIVLESLHGLKVQWYLNASNELRRLMLRLAHAHGVLLALLNVAFALTLKLLAHSPPRFASRCLLAATVLLPCGFLTGGIVFYGGDPGLGILLVPFGAALLFIAVFLTALSATRGP